MATSPAALFPSLTRKRCDCCDEEFVDEVAEMLIWEAVEAFVVERDAKVERDESTVMDARAEARQALAAARAGRGA
jgi:hypothetical protein